MTMTTEKTKLYAYRPHGRPEGVAGIVYQGDGTFVTGHVSWDVIEFRSHLGLSKGGGKIARLNRDRYDKACPGGYELVEVIGREELDRLKEAGEATGIQVSWAGYGW